MNRLFVLLLPMALAACGIGASDRQLAQAQYTAQSEPFGASTDPKPTGDTLQLSSRRNWGYQEHLLGVPDGTKDY